MKKEFYSLLTGAVQLQKKLDLFKVTSLKKVSKIKPIFKKKNLPHKKSYKVFRVLEKIMALLPRLHAATSAAAPATT